MSEIPALSIAEIAASLRRREVSATELVTAAIARHERYGATLAADPGGDDGYRGGAHDSRWWPTTGVVPLSSWLGLFLEDRLGRG